MAVALMVALVMEVAMVTTVLVVAEVAAVTTVLVVAAIPIPDSTHVHQVLRVWQARTLRASDSCRLRHRKYFTGCPGFFGYHKNYSGAE